MQQKPVCPSCNGAMTISELHCKQCGIKISGDFSVGGFELLNEDELTFIKSFLAFEGNISKMQDEYGITYKSVKDKINTINYKLGGKVMENSVNIGSLQINDSDSKVVRKLKSSLLECGGKGLMPVLKGEPVPFWLVDNMTGVESAGLKGVVLKWEVFDAIVKKAVSLGGKMYRGDGAAQSGARIGSEDLPITTIDGFISTEFFGSQIGDTTLRRSTYFSGILAWANIATNHRSQGNGGFITINPEYMSED